MTKPATADGYILSELEVWGRGGRCAAEAHPRRRAGALNSRAARGGSSAIRW